MDTPTLYRFPADALLRAHGWVIVARPKRGEPLWQRTSGRRQPRTQHEALARVFRKYEWKPVADAWMHASGKTATFAEVLELVLRFEMTRPEKFRN